MQHWSARPFTPPKPIGKDNWFASGYNHLLPSLYGMWKADCSNRFEKRTWQTVVYSVKLKEKLILWAKGYRKTLDPHRKAGILMDRALNQFVICFYGLRASENVSLAESGWFKARIMGLPEGRTWKEKNLDYEIETDNGANLTRGGGRLEKKRTSITRLKHQPCHTHHQSYKNPWKEKNLDYEIETILYNFLCQLSNFFLKRKEPRLRDWNSTKNL